MVGVDACPVFDHGKSVLRRHVGESEMVLWRKREDVADACDTLSLEKKGLEIWQSCVSIF